MTKPTEINLEVRNDINGVLSLAVNNYPNFLYNWQRCKAGTTNWESIGISYSYKYDVSYSSVSLGEKFRCLISNDKKVVFFSKTFTASESFFLKVSEGISSQERQYQPTKPHVSDTDNMDGYEFEVYCAELLKQNGFTDIQVTKGSGDYGVDILAYKDTISYAIQCKCYQSPVGNKAVQEAYSGKSFYNCMVAVVLTNNYFTDAAIETAKRNSVILWNRDYLAEMISKSISSNQESNGTEG